MSSRDPATAAAIKAAVARADLADDEPTQFALAVVRDGLIAGPHVRAACRRHLKDLATGQARGLVYLPDKAARPVRFFATVLTVEIEDIDDTGLKQSRSVPFVLQPWQAFIVGSLFGWYRATGFRRFRRAFSLLGKGNGKSPLAAGIGLYMLTAEGKLRGEVYRRRWACFISLGSCGRSAWARLDRCRLETGAMNRAIYVPGPAFGRPRLLVR